MLSLSNLKIGDSIKNNNPFRGEGEYIVADLSPKLFEGAIKVIAAKCRKYPGLNGQCSYLDIDSLQFYHKVD